MKANNKQSAKVIDLGKQKYARMVLAEFDKLKREEKRSRNEVCAEVERKARKQF